MHILLRLFIDSAVRRGVMRDCYVVGGAVRDLIFGRTTSDYDIVIRLNAEQFARDFADDIGGKCIILDEQSGTMRVTKDGDYLDLCRMQGESIADDLGRRDITINAMALPLRALQETDPSQRLIDPFDGTHDLAWKTVRMVREQNLLDDPLRMLRVYRFAQSLNFTPEIHTLNAIRQNGSLIADSAVERVAEELRHILGGSKSYPTLKLMLRDGFVDHLFPELAALPKERRQKQLQSYGYLEHILNNLPLYFSEHAPGMDSFFTDPQRTVSMKLALLFPDPAIAESCARRLKLSRREIDGIALIGQYLDVFTELMGGEDRERLRLIHTLKDNLYMLVLFLICQECICQMVDSPVLYYCREMVALYQSVYQEHARLLPLLTGADLIQEFHMEPSPVFGKVLRAIELMVVDGSVRTRADAAEAARLFIANPE